MARVTSAAADIVTRLMRDGLASLSQMCDAP